MSPRQCTCSLVVALATLMAAGGARGNPCPPPPVGSPPPYLPLTGTVVSAGDTVNAPPIEQCLIMGGTLEMTGLLTNNGHLFIGFLGGTLRLDAGGGALLNAGVYETSAGVSGSGSPVPGSGLVDNHGSIVNLGQFASAGVFLNAGSIENDSAGRFTLETDSTSNGDISNRGDFIVTGVEFAATFANNGNIHNELGGTFEVLFAAGVLANGGSFDNAGAFHLTGTLLNGAGGSFANSGTLTNLGTIETALASRFDNTGALLNSGAFNHAGTLNNSGGGAFTNGGNFINLGGTVNNLNPGTVFTNSGVFSNAAGGLLNNADGASFVNQGLLTNSGLISNGSLLSVQGAAGSVDNQGLVNNVGGTITIDALAGWRNSGTLANSSDQVAAASGTIEAAGTVLNLGSGLILNQPGGTFTLAAGGRLTNQDAARIDNRGGALFDVRGQLINDATFDNAGTVRLSGSITGNGVYTQTAGLTKLLGGTLDQALIDIQGGSLLGAGTLRGLVRVGHGATIGPGDPQQTTIDGQLVLAGTLLLQIAGPADFDRLHVTGSADLSGGSVVFDFIGGYAPQPGASFADIVQAGSGFSGLGSVQFIFLDVDPALGLQVNAGATGLALVVGVPEPSGATLLGLGLLVLTWLAARRRALLGAAPRRQPRPGAAAGRSGAMPSA